MDLAGLAWPLAFTAFGALMFAVCTYRRNRVCSHAVAALECAHATMLAIESGDQEEGRSVVDSGPFAEQLDSGQVLSADLAGHFTGHRDPSIDDAVVHADLQLPARRQSE